MRGREFYFAVFPFPFPVGRRGGKTNLKRAGWRQAGEIHGKGDNELP
jgi:hypothetical protein